MRVTKQGKEDMTNATGSNNIDGLLGGLLEAVDTVLGMAERKLSDFAEGAEDEEDRERWTYKIVSELSLMDVLVLEDGDWDVRSIQSDGFDEDIVSVTLENGETYNLIRTALVRVV